MTINEIKDLFFHAAETLAAQELELCRIDADTGDGDHGIAIARVARAIQAAASESTSDTAAFFSAICANIMKINGGSCIPLCANIFDGMADAAAVSQDGVSLMKAVFAGALEGIRFISSAKVGEKTMLDALIPAVDAAQRCDGDELAVLRAAADAAQAGSDATRNMKARYGRAKNLPDGGVGHLDAGSVSIAVFLRALYQSAVETERK